METEKIIEHLKKMMNWSDDEARKKLAGPAGKYYVQKVELYVEHIKRIDPNVDSLKVHDNPLEAVLDTRKNLSESQKDYIRQGIYRDNYKVYKIR